MVLFRQPPDRTLPHTHTAPTAVHCVSIHTHTQARPRPCKSTYTREHIEIDACVQDSQAYLCRGRNGECCFCRRRRRRRQHTHTSIYSLDKTVFVCLLCERARVCMCASVRYVQFYVFYAQRLTSSRRPSVDAVHVSAQGYPCFAKCKFPHQAMLHKVNTHTPNITHLPQMQSHIRCKWSTTEACTFDCTMIYKAQLQQFKASLDVVNLCEILPKVRESWSGRVCHT